MDRKQAWMLIEKDAREKPELCQVADKLEISLDVCFSRWFCLWNWIDDQFPDGKLAGITFRALDQVSGIAGLAEALSDVEWIRQIEGGLEVPDFEKRWGRIAVKRYLAAARTRRWRAKRQSAERASDAAGVENVSTGTDRAVDNLSTGAEANVTQTSPARHGCDAGSVTGVTPARHIGDAPRADLTLGSSPLVGSYPYFEARAARAALRTLEKGKLDWEKVRSDANEISRWVRIKDAPNNWDENLILGACILAQGPLNQVWLWEAVAAVKRQAGPINAAAFFRGCLIRGLGQFVGPQPKQELQALYRELEKLAWIPNWKQHIKANQSQDDDGKPEDQARTA